MRGGVFCNVDIGGIVERLAGDGKAIDGEAIEIDAEFIVAQRCLAAITLRKQLRAPGARDSSNVTKSSCPLRSSASCIGRRTLMTAPPSSIECSAARIAAGEWGKSCNE